MQCHVTAVYAVSICNTCDLRQMWLAYYQTFSPPGSCSILVFSHKCSVKFNIIQAWFTSLGVSNRGGKTIHDTHIGTTEHS